MAEQPHDASRKSQAEGDRWDEIESAGDYRPDDRGADIANREDLETPRRYEQPLADDEDPVMPADDSTTNTKI